MNKCIGISRIFISCYRIWVEIYNSHPIITRARWSIDMEWWAWWQSSRCYNVQLTSYNWQSRMKNGHRMVSSHQDTTIHNSHSIIARAGKNGYRMINMTTVTKVPQYTTHQLWLPEWGEEWSWNNEYNHSQDANSPPVISRAEWRIISIITDMPPYMTHLL